MKRAIFRSSDERTGLIAAPDFALTATDGRKVRLSEYLGAKNIVLVFNRGFG